MKVTKPKINRKITNINFTDANRTVGQIKYIVKHYVGATGSAEANANYFENTYRGASAHFFVGHEGEIWQSVEENDIAWHSGASTYKHLSCRNSNSIGVELCVKKDKNGNWYYTEKTTKAAIQLFAYLMEKYSIPRSCVLRHYDVTGKICGEPDVRVNNKVWNQFKADISKYGNEDKQQEQAAAGYQIITTCDKLYVRAGAGTSNKVVGEISEKAGKKNRYTIVEEKNGWGKLKSGIGWICLKFTQKVS